MRRWDSAAIWPKTSELLPEPEPPVNTVRRRLGISTSTSRRLFCRAPCTRMRSCRSAVDGGGESCSVVLAMGVGLLCGGRSGNLLQPDHIARWVAERAVAHSPVLIGGFLHDLRAGGLDLLEGAVHEIGRAHV